jgi:hypothetical protein
MDGLVWLGVLLYCLWAFRARTPARSAAPSPPRMM